MSAGERRRVVVIAGLAESLLNFRGPLLREMVRSGHTVFAVAPPNAQVARALHDMGVEFRPISLARAGLNPLRDLWAAIQLVLLLREIKPQLVLSYTIKPVIYGGLASSIVGVPTFAAMITGLGYVFSREHSFAGRCVSAVARVLYRIALRDAAVVFFQNPDDNAEFCRLGLVSKARTVLINGSGVDLQHFARRPLPDKIAFLMIARLVKDKGVVEYFEACRQLRLQYPQIRCVLAGGLDPNPNGLSRSELERLLSQGGIDYVGELDDVRDAIASCAVYVLPSYREGTPRTVLEAMSIGRPVITTDAPGCRETIVHGESGLLVPPRDSQALLLAMRKMVEEPRLLESMGRAARQRAEQKYDVRAVNARILSATDLWHD
jgi:glycosyltransferase involved in cell wall biosynthesis